jgi:phosphate/sulfate permease
MEKKISIIVIVTVIALLFGFLFSYIQISLLQNQIIELQAENSELTDQINQLQDQKNELHEENSELQQQLDLLQKRVNFEPEVEISKFSAPEGWQYIGGTTKMLDCIIVISNTGLIDLEGLTLEVQRRDLEEEPKKVTYELNVFPAGETIEIQYTSTSNYDLGFDFSYVATLKFGEVVLDAKYLLS